MQVMIPFLEYELSNCRPMRDVFILQGFTKQK
jgi:hypothetical protein